MPKVSVVMASYNHEKYIRECIQSILDQTYHDFEFIITDDGSQDRSVEIIQGFNDPRINLYTHVVNKGACVAANLGIRKASGQYIAIVNSDDAWEHTKLEQQVDFLDKHPEIGAVFTMMTFIDESSKPILEKQHWYTSVFQATNKSRFAWLNQFFCKGNCLCHPSVLIRKKCYDEIGLLDERMASLPDFDMWIRLCLKYEIHIMNSRLVRFRLRDNDMNASGANKGNLLRANFEYFRILNNYLTIKDKHEFANIFPEANKYGVIETKYIPYFLSRLALDVKNNTLNLWGLEVLYNLLADKEIEKELDHKYKFNYVDFYKITSAYDVFNINSTNPKLDTAIFVSNTDHRNIFLKFSIRIHWMMANLARKYVLK